MRNLKLQYCREITDIASEVKFLLFDPNVNKTNDLIYYATANKLFAQRGNAVEPAVEIAEVPDIVGAEFLALENEICLATALGEVLIINPQTRAVTEGTFCDVGIECMAFSPDQEVVAFVTKTHNIVVMTCTYDVIAEHALADYCAAGETQFVNVGWGKKETQFHGSEGKTAAKQKSDFQAPDNVQDLPQQIEITWRADGAYFAVSFVSETVGRMFKVFDKEGKLQYISEKINDLQPSIEWRPSGTWIAVPQRLPNKSVVALFEKNGLRHREIVLPFNLALEPITSLKWNADSDILTLETECQTTQQRRLYLYTIGNYHWYLKQVLSFHSEDPIAIYSWDNRIGEEKCLHVILKSGKYLSYCWHYHIDKYKRSGIIAVIDGQKLLLTNFAKTIIPPPMSNAELDIDAYANACAFIANENAELQLLIYDHNKVLHLYKSLLTAELNFKKICLMQAAADTNIPQLPLALSNLFWFNEHHLIATTATGNNTNVLLISLDFEEQVYRLESTLQLNGTVSALCNGSTELEQFFVQTLAGVIYQLTVKPDKSLKLHKLYAELKHAADQLQWFTSTNFEHCALISLKSNQSLYIDTTHIASDVTSFCLAGNYLAYTKLTALLFLRLDTLLTVDERKIERGGKLLTTIANDSRTILQMPRGNLEAICPRVLSLEIVGALLERKCYNAAMNILRKQRINLNIICDHNMNSFVDNLDVFLEEIKNPNWLNLFMSDLQNEDFTKTMYASNYKADAQVYQEGFKIEHKVNYLCEKLCERMEQSNDERFRLPIITAYVKTGKLEKALQTIWQEKRNESSNDTISHKAEDALKYLLYLVDVNELYNVALGTYDFGLVLFVAQKSQKDPKEFLPFLNELKALEENYRKFKIDEHLKRYQKSLQYIIQCGSEKFDEALAFIKRHELYRQALKCYEQYAQQAHTADKLAEQQQCQRQVCLAFADYLRANGKLENASIMYERGGNLTQALLSAKHVLDWQRALYLARKDKQQVATVALSLIASLQENGKHLEAYHLCKTYGDNFAEALQCLLKGKLYLKAIFEVNMFDNADNEPINILDTLIKPDLIAYHGILESNVLADQKLFVNHKQRLLAVREQRQVDNRKITDYDYNNAEIDECDLLSDTTSMHSSRYTSSSRGTGKTFRSSKNRRKHERKLLSLKPGNAFEDIALIDALHNLIVKICSQQQNIRDTCKALMELQLDAAAAVLQKHFKQLLVLLQESLDEIWIPEIMTTKEFLNGPNVDYASLVNEQRYGLLNPQKRFKPQLNIIDWEHEILR